MIGTRQFQEMDASQSSGASAPPAEERAAAGGNLVEGDPSVSSRTPQASVQAAQSIARGDNQLSEAESTGARDINVPEKETAAVRRDGEPLMNAAKRRRQTESETDAEEPQTDAGERPPSPLRGDEEEPPPLAEDPAGQQARLAAMKKQLASIAAQPRVLWLPRASAEMQTPAEADLVPSEADRGSAEERLVPAEERLAPAEADLVPSEADRGSAEERLVPAEADLVPAEEQLVLAEADLVPAEADQGSAGKRLAPAQMQLVSAEVDLVPAEADLASTGARPADTARKRTPSAVTEDPGPVLPSEQEAGATALCAEATRPVESPEALTSPQSRAGMPAGVGEGPGEPRDAVPSPPRQRCKAAGGDGWRSRASRRNPGLIEEFRGLPPAARLSLVRERGLCSRCLSRCDPEGERMHERCRLKSRLENELCQRQHKCRQTHHRLLHVEAESEKNTQTARLAKPAEPPDRPGRSPTHSQAKASRRMSAGTPEVAAARRKSREHGSDADSGGRAATPVARCAALRVRPAAPAARETVQPAGASEGEAARRRSGGGRPQQQQKAAGKQRTTAGRCEREQIARTANAAHQEESAKSYDEMRRACAELCLGTEKFLEPLNRALKGDSVKAIKSHREALLSEVERIEGAAAREAQARGQDLNEVKELMRRMLTRTQDTLRAADITLCKWKAAHHAACIEDLADEAFEVQDGTWDWSAQGCTDFRKELDWGLQAFRKANTKLELRLMETDERRAARLRAERVEIAASRAREVVEKVLWDRRSRWESIHPEES